MCYKELQLIWIETESTKFTFLFKPSLKLQVIFSEMSIFIIEMTLLTLDIPLVGLGRLRFEFWCFFPALLVIFSFKLLLNSFRTYEINWVSSLFLKSCLLLNEHGLEFICTPFVFNGIIVYLKWTIIKR